MAGASPNHGRITANLMRCFGIHLHNTPCEPFCADQMLKTSTGKYHYPDVLVTCDNEFIDNGRVTQTPVIIVEIISRSTRKIDESPKKLEYINIPTLRAALEIN
jgi:Uma2 family endonuclease